MRLASIFTQSSLAIPTVANGGNHTAPFAKSARSAEAHKATMTVSKGLAWTGFRVIADDEFYRQVGDHGATVFMLQ